VVTSAGTSAAVGRGRVWILLICTKNML
jgi:hypothetical protein